MNLQLVVLAHAAGDQRPGDHRPESLHGEHAIDGQAQGRARIFRRSFRRQPRQLALEVVESRASLRTHRHHGSARRIEKRSPQVLRHFHAHDFEGLGIHQVGFGQHRDAALHREQAADVEVLAGLRLHRLVGRNHQQHQVDAADSRQHVAHEALMTGHIDEAQPQVLSRRCFQIEVGEANVDGDPAPFFFFQAIGIGAGQRAHQRALSVVNVARGPHDDGLHASSVNNRLWNSGSALVE